MERNVLQPIGLRHGAGDRSQEDAQCGGEEQIKRSCPPSIAFADQRRSGQNDRQHRHLIDEHPGGGR